MYKKLHVFVPYVLVVILVILALGIFSLANRLQNPQALQSNPYAQEVSEPKVCAPKTSSGACSGPGEVWEKGGPSECTRKGGIPVGGSCDSVCCKMAGKMPWKDQDSCAGLSGSKEICESFNSCPFNYMCKWDEATKTCGSAKSGELPNPWCPNPSKGGTCYTSCTQDSDCTGPDQACMYTGVGTAFGCKNRFCPSEYGCVCPTPTLSPTSWPTITPALTLGPCGNGMDYDACVDLQARNNKSVAWYQCACDNRGGCFSVKDDPYKICPGLFPTQSPPDNPLNSNLKKSSGASSSEVQNAGGLYRYQQGQ